MAISFLFFFPLLLIRSGSVFVLRVFNPFVRKAMASVFAGFSLLYDSANLLGGAIEILVVVDIELLFLAGDESLGDV